MKGIEEITMFIKNSTEDELNIFSKNIDEQMRKCVMNDKVNWKRLYDITEILRVEINSRVKETPVEQWRALLYNNI